MAPILSALSQRRVDLAPETPGLVEAVAPGSLADMLGLQPGDRVRSVDGRPLLDALDFQFRAQAERVSFEFERNGDTHKRTLELDGDEFWGVTFADPTFDG